MFYRCIFTVLLLMIASCSFADDIVPHTFDAGDVISADVLNETLGKIGDSKKLLSMDDLIGTWQCTKYSYRGLENITAGYQDVDPDGIWQCATFTLTISNDGDGTYSWATSGKHPWMYANNDDIPAVNPDITAFDSSGSIAMATNTVVAYGNVTISGNVDDGGWLYTVERMSNIRMRFVYHYGSPILLLEKQNIPPAIPTQLSADVDDLVVTLSWIDNSANETGFKILRKGTIRGGFNLVTTTGADAVTYQDTVPEAGRYWYRVKATNANGDSIGSKVVKVIVIGE